MLSTIVAVFKSARKIETDHADEPADLWELVNPMDVDPMAANWYYGTDEHGFGMMHFTYGMVDPACLPNFVRYDNPAELAYVRHCAQMTEDAPDRLSDDPNTPAAPVGPGPCPF